MITPTAIAAGLLLSLSSAYLIPYLPAEDTGTLTIAWYLINSLWMLAIWRQQVGKQVGTQNRKQIGTQNNLTQTETQKNQLSTQTETHEQTRTQNNQLSANLILGIGVVARLLLLGVPGFASNDTERYLWDGAVLLNGFDPYQLHPDHPALASLRAIWPTPEEHAAYPTLYPPLALGIFSLCAIAGADSGIWAWKLVTTCASIACLFVVYGVLKKLGQQRHLALFSVSPLVLLETGVNAHVDSLSMLAISLMLWFSVHKQWLWAGVAIGLGASIKLLPLLALGPLLFANPQKNWPRILFGVGAALAVCYGVATFLHLVPVGSLATFFLKWRFGSPVYSLIEWLHSLGAPNLFAAINLQTILILLAVIAGAIALWLSRRDLHRGLTLMLSIPLILSPVVFPWYLVVLVPLATIRPNILLQVWLITAPFSYEVLNDFASTNTWEPATWPLWVIAAGWVVGFCVSTSRTKSNSP